MGVQAPSEAICSEYQGALSLYSVICDQAVINPFNWETFHFVCTLVNSEHHLATPKKTFSSCHARYLDIEIWLSVVIHYLSLEMSWNLEALQYCSVT